MKINKFYAASAIIIGALLSVLSIPNRVLAATYTLTTISTSLNPSVVTPKHSSAASAIILVIGLIFVIFQISCLWKIFVKAGRRGWYSLIPFYNMWVSFEISGYAGWWAILLLIPIIGFVALVVSFMASYRLTKRFGKGVWFWLFWVVIFQFIGYGILAYGKAKYNPNYPKGTPTASPNNNSQTLPDGSNTPPMPPVNPSLPTPNVVNSNNSMPTTPTVADNQVKPASLPTRVVDNQFTPESNVSPTSHQIFTPDNRPTLPSEPSDQNIDSNEPH